MDNKHKTFFCNFVPIVPRQQANMIKEGSTFDPTEQTNIKAVRYCQLSSRKEFKDRKMVTQEGGRERDGEAGREKEKEGDG